MKTIHHTKLTLNKGKIEKTCLVELCQVKEQAYVVNYRIGRKGKRLQEGTLTRFPVPYTKAMSDFERFIKNKKLQGYIELAVPSMAKVTSEPIPIDEIEGMVAQKAAVLKHLKRAVDFPSRVPDNKEWSLSRVIWRAGEFKMTIATPYLVGLHQRLKEDNLFHYCNAWGLGRCGVGNKTAIVVLEHYAYCHKDKAVQRIALEGLRAATQGEQHQAFLNHIFKRLPTAFQSQLENEKFDTFEKTVDEYLYKSKKTDYEFMERLYLLDNRYPIIRKIICNFAQKATLRPNYFRTLRHLFKAAEFRQDGQLFGILARRFEKSAAMFKKPSAGVKIYLDGKNYNSVEELKKPNSKLAFSNKTRAYLNRRVMRTLKKTGDYGDLNYVQMATGVLLAFDHKKDFVAPRKDVRWTYDSSIRRYRKVTTYYGAYAPYLGLNFILYQNSDRYELRKDSEFWSFKRNRHPNQPAPEKREEAYPELWDKVPQALIHLMVESNIQPVQEFAVRAFKANPQYQVLIKRFDIPLIIQFINKNIEVITNFGIDLALVLYDEDNPNMELIRALMDSPNNSAQRIAQSWIGGKPTFFFQDTVFVKDLLTSQHQSVRLWIGSMLAEITLPQRTIHTIIVRTFAHLMGLETQPENEQLFREISRTLQLVFADQLKNISLNVIRDLLQHPLKAAQFFAGRLLLNHETPAEKLPDDIIMALLNSKEAAIREQGIALFGQFSDKTLLKRGKVLARFYTSKLQDVRVAVRPIVLRMANNYKEFAELLVLEFTPHLLRKEKYEGIHSDMLKILTEDLRAHLGEIDRKLIFRLLNSNHIAGQELGVFVFKQNMNVNDVTVRQIIRLANHQLLSARKTAWEIFSNHVGRIRYERDEAIRILDVDWDDSREFGCNFFRTHFGEKDWTPQLLVSVCDSTRPDIQAFGREMMTKFFTQQNGEEYLLKLSQHPSPDLQLFATNYLVEFASDNLEHLKTLEFFFITVLSQVNKSRVAKDRILAFLHTEGLKNPVAARLVASILGRTSLTIAIGDKAKCIEILRDIHQKYPHVKVVISVSDPEERVVVI